MVDLHRLANEAGSLREPPGHPAYRGEFVGDIRLTAPEAAVLVDGQRLAQHVFGRPVVSGPGQDNTETVQCARPSRVVATLPRGERGSPVQFHGLPPRPG